MNSNITIKWDCRYDGKPCEKDLCCGGCDRMHLENLPNSNAPTETVIWEDDFGEGGTGYAKCPKCHELAYGLIGIAPDEVGQCPFCGQHYSLDAEGKEKAKPNPEETITCPMCGKETLVGRRAKSNGHFHGQCTNCGCRIFQ